ncbi:cation:proton antiporter [Streptomyces sp. NPDC054804]
MPPSRGPVQDPRGRPRAVPRAVWTRPRRVPPCTWYPFVTDSWLRGRLKELTAEYGPGFAADLRGDPDRLLGQGPRPAGRHVADHRGRHGPPRCPPLAYDRRGLLGSAAVLLRVRGEAIQPLYGGRICGLYWGRLLVSAPDPVTGLLIAVPTVIVACPAGSALARRIGQPPVVGEIAAGILLGPSLLGMVWPAGQTWLIPPASVPYLGALGRLGLLVFMFLIGLELDLGLVRGLGRTALVVSQAGIGAPSVGTSRGPAGCTGGRTRRRRRTRICRPCAHGLLAPSCAVNPPWPCMRSSTASAQQYTSPCRAVPAAPRFPTRRPWWRSTPRGPSASAYVEPRVRRSLPYPGVRAHQQDPARVLAHWLRGEQAAGHRSPQG